MRSQVIMEDWKILIDRAMAAETQNTIEAHKIYGDAVRSALAQTQITFGLKQEKVSLDFGFWIAESAACDF